LEEINAVIVGNLGYILIGILIIIALLIAFIISLESKISDMRKRLRKIIMSDDNTSNSQEILIKHAEKISSAVDAEEKLTLEINKLQELVKKSICRVAVVRFNAFNDNTAELSYCIALLDAENNGVIISSLTGRDFSRSYVKPIEKGASPNYKLTKEEEQALREASVK
jgi:hypothetical protein